MRVDEVVIREFLHTSYPRLVAAVALTSGSRPAAEDAVQEALLGPGNAPTRARRSTRWRGE
jgi:DNA-directed RNA polymerase specialized sigma24 family protein